MSDSTYVDPYVNHTGTIKLPDGRYQHTLSQSFLNAFMRCPEQARAQYFREVDREETDSTALGKAVHVGIEYALNEIRDTGDFFLEEIIDVALHELELIGKWKYTKISADKMRATVPIMLGAWTDVVAPTLEPAAVEASFNLELYSGKHRVIRLGGTMDMLDMNLEPHDWKTASREYEPWEYQRFAIQPTVYCWASAKQMGENHLAPTFFHYAVMLHNGGVQQFEVWRDQTHVEWLKQICSQVAWMIEHNAAGPWPMQDNGWHCAPTWCGNWDNCKGKFMVGDAWKKRA